MRSRDYVTPIRCVAQTRDGARVCYAKSHQPLFVGTKLQRVSSFEQKLETHNRTRAAAQLFVWLLWLDYSAAHAQHITAFMYSVQCPS